MKRLKNKIYFFVLDKPGLFEQIIIIQNILMNYLDKLGKYNRNST